MRTHALTRKQFATRDRTSHRRLLCIPFSSPKFREITKKKKALVDVPSVHSNNSHTSTYSRHFCAVYAGDVISTSSAAKSTPVCSVRTNLSYQCDTSRCATLVPIFAVAFVRTNIDNISTFVLPFACFLGANFESLYLHGNKASFQIIYFQQRNIVIITPLSHNKAAVSNLTSSLTFVANLCAFIGSSSRWAIVFLSAITY